MVGAREFSGGWSGRGGLCRVGAAVGKGREKPTGCGCGRGPFTAELGTGLGLYIFSLGYMVWEGAYYGQQVIKMGKGATGRMKLSYIPWR